MVARVVRDDEAAGSNPVTPTNIEAPIRNRTGASLFELPPSAQDAKSERMPTVTVDEPTPPGQAVPSDLRKVVVVGDPVLSTPTRQVTDFHASLAQLIDDMFATMKVAEGVGLAAPQVGVDLAVFVYDCPDGPAGEHRRGYLVNPVVVTADGPIESSDEGCLSVPGPFYETARATHVVVRGVDKTGAAVEVEGHGYFARCLLHETDHLNGTLYIDYMPRNRRRKLLREMVPYAWNAQPLT